MTERSRVTISDVAKAAAVSSATVSRVMNGQTTVDPALAERVRQVARRLALYTSYGFAPLASDGLRLFLPITTVRGAMQGG